jgi:hypothetical protein
MRTVEELGTAGWAKAFSREGVPYPWGPPLSLIAYGLQGLPFEVGGLQDWL